MKNKIKNLKLETFKFLICLNVLKHKLQRAEKLKILYVRSQRSKVKKKIKRNRWII